jgi:hypothetical protein
MDVISFFMKIKRFNLLRQILAKFMMNQLWNGGVPDCQNTGSIMTDRTDPG